MRGLKKSNAKMSIQCHSGSGSCGLRNNSSRAAVWYQVSSSDLESRLVYSIEGSEEVEQPSMGMIISRLFGWRRRRVVEHAVPGMYMHDDIETGQESVDVQTIQRPVVPLRRTRSATDMTIHTRRRSPIGGLFEIRRAASSMPTLSPSACTLPPGIEHGIVSVTYQLPFKLCCSMVESSSHGIATTCSF
ncbi:unnamed protein product [Orchesella dallaii]|uniref:Uncharacterized protein n=1 Tax=Orchesella dallaii TaxID=48710 RepID=A0ABP1RKJ1_9HEXA